MGMSKFNVPFARPGSMFRGNPPNGKLLRLTGALQRSLLAPKEMDVELDSVRLNITPKVKRDISSALSMMKPLKKESNNDAMPAAADASPGSGPDSPELCLAVQLTRKGNKNMTLYNRDVDLTSANGTEDNDMSNHCEAAGMEGGHTVVIENPPQGLVHFGVNQGHSPQLLLKLERGKSKPLKKKSNFSAIVKRFWNRRQERIGQPGCVF